MGRPSPARSRRDGPALLAQSGLLLGVVRLGLSALRFGTLLRALEALGEWGPDGGVSPALSAEEITRAIRRASRWVPGGRSCLVQALAARALLRRNGHPAELRFGVGWDAAGRLAAHAWVECRGVAVIGGGNPPGYAPLPDLGGNRR